MRLEPRQNSVATQVTQNAAKNRNSGDVFRSVVLFLVVFFLIKLFIVEGYQVSGPSMAPTLEDRDRILVFKLPFALQHIPVLAPWAAPEANDIVVFREQGPEKSNFVKRVIAANPEERSSDTVSASTASTSRMPWANALMLTLSETDIYVNAQRVDQSFLLPWERDVRAPNGVIYLQPGELYVMGDHRSVSRDSRDFGPIHQSQIIGAAVFRIWPLSRFGPL